MDMMRIKKEQDLTQKEINAFQSCTFLKKNAYLYLDVNFLNIEILIIIEN